MQYDSDAAALPLKSPLLTVHTCLPVCCQQLPDQRGQGLCGSLSEEGIIIFLCKCPVEEQQQSMHLYSFCRIISFPSFHLTSMNKTWLSSLAHEYVEMPWASLCKFTQLDRQRPNFVWPREWPLFLCHSHMARLSVCSSELPKSLAPAGIRDFSLIFFSEAGERCSDWTETSRMMGVSSDVSDQNKKEEWVWWGR